MNWTNRGKFSGKIQVLNWQSIVESAERNTIGNKRFTHVNGNNRPYHMHHERLFQH